MPGGGHFEVGSVKQGDVFGADALVADGLPVTEAAPQPATPDNPAYQQILAVFAHAGRPMRARDLCEALDLPILPKNTEGIRSKLKRLVSRGILRPRCSRGSCSRAEHAQGGCRPAPRPPLSRY
ncbi:hypothetical protein [Streptomyces himalayensis]|uniref:hypothetical protein n=1 Tax=Streptomyces himalayensis TaxID=2820085 RepID=UPI00215DACF2|nr:hypothetical protein [Streptomyces himalayensis]